jgi:hypothetical protein
MYTFCKLIMEEKSCVHMSQILTDVRIRKNFENPILSQTFICHVAIYIYTHTQCSLPCSFTGIGRAIIRYMMIFDNFYAVKSKKEKLSLYLTN